MMNIRGVGARGSASSKSGSLTRRVARVALTRTAKITWILGAGQSLLSWVGSSAAAINYFGRSYATANSIKPLFPAVLVANRGAIALRIIRTLRKMGIKAVAVYSEPDADSRHVVEADAAVCIGGGPATESYLNGAKIIEAALQTGAKAIHPGYGFLSENAEFAEQCAQAGLVFVGPTPQQMRDFGLKHLARALAMLNGVPMLPGTDLIPDLETAKREAARIGYPLMLKGRFLRLQQSTAGGGGIGMRLCHSEEDLVDAFDSVKRLASSAFRNNGIFLEKFVQVARHIEVQVFGDGRGKVVALGERDCSAQRRNQKVLEETPAPGLSPELRAKLHGAAIRLCEAVGYQSAGTVEFLFDVSTFEFYFLEVNTRLQVEHGVTEEVTGVDLVEWMIKAAAGALDLSSFKAEPKGWSIQARIYAEDPNKNFQPSPGLLTAAEFPTNGARVETHVVPGALVPPFYDSMLGKIITKGATRAEALQKLSQALAATRVAGIESNVEYLRQIVAAPEFAAGAIHIKWLNSFTYKPHTLDVLEPGTQTSIQDYPGRVGYWGVGVPPSGPMDDYAHRIANALVHNAPDAAAMEITLSGPTLRFNTDATIALTGAEFDADIDGNPIEWWRSIHVRAGAVLRIRGVKGAGCRCVLAVHGGFDVPSYLGSRATFSLGKFGGHGGRTIQTGDVIHLNKPQSDKGEKATNGVVPAAFKPIRRAPSALVPTIASHWQIGVTYGPHAAPDFFTEKSIEVLFNSDYKVHYNSNRLGVRLVGPKPEFSRKDGGEAGLHPSNIHDTQYAVGTLNFTGELPVILAKDGPSLGGFVCPVTIIASELWKVGQLKPGDTIRFVRTTYQAAAKHRAMQDQMIASLQVPQTDFWTFLDQESRLVAPTEDAILRSLPARGKVPAVVYRAAGDRAVLLEYGPLELDLNLRFRVHALTQWFKARPPVPGLLELAPGVRSLQVQFDGRLLPRDKLLDLLVQAESELPPVDEMTVPSRIVRMPLAFNASTTKLAIEKYRQSIRDQAPWLPSNIEFMRRLNGLKAEEDVQKTVFAASYMVLGLGDVYLGAPCAVPLDPRHRLQTTKYNPARTWTAEGETGIGGVYMCIYGMESPGGYQLIGRTVPVWNTFNATAEFKRGEPWLLRFFDQVQFYPVEEDELNKIRRDFIRGSAKLSITERAFSVSDYAHFLHMNAPAIKAFKEKQNAAFEAERERWAATGAASMSDASADATPPPPQAVEAPPGGELVKAPISGSVRAVTVKVGDRVDQGDKLVVVEAMKMEVNVFAGSSGVVVALNVTPGSVVEAGQTSVVLGPIA